MNIVFITSNKFPNGDAGAVRDYMFGKMLKLKGHDVFFIGMGDSSIYEIMNYNGFSYISLKRIYSNKIEKINSYISYSIRLKEYLEDHVLRKKIDALWIVSLPLNALIMVKEFAKKYNIKLIHDSVEWYSSKQFKLGRLSPAYISKNITNRYLIDDNFSVIAISKYLENHFKNRNNNTTRIPILFDKNEIQYKKKQKESKLILLYAGSPGKKDYLKIMLKGLTLLSSEQLKKIEFRIIGVSKYQIYGMFKYNKSSLYKIIDSLNILGKISRANVIENLYHADFTVLLRDSEQRYAKAGFPTKVVESLATGTPIITNITSDLGDYIFDGESGIIVNNCTSESFSISIIKALYLPDDVKQQMSTNARLNFEKNFDYKLYLELVDKLLNRPKI